jgi:hypothetical protein
LYGGPVGGVTVVEVRELLVEPGLLDDRRTPATTATTKTTTTPANAAFVLSAWRKVGALRK